MEKTKFGINFESKKIFFFIAIIFLIFSILYDQNEFSNLIKNQLRIAKILIRYNGDEHKTIIAILNSHFNHSSKIADSALKVLEDQAMLKWIGEPLLEKDRLNQVLSLCTKIAHELTKVENIIYYLSTT